MAVESSAHVVLIESNVDLAGHISQDLQEAGFEVAIAHTAEEGLAAIRQRSPALIAIDRLLEGESSLPYCQAIRQQGVRVPIILMMARDALEDRVSCLESGADDFFLKPYRSDAFLKMLQFYLKPSTNTGEMLRFGELSLDLAHRSALRNGRVIDLTMKEFELLKYLMEHPREVMTREQILENVWGYDFLGESNVIEVYIRYLRLKIDGEDEKRLIQTVRGVGYVLREG